MPASSAVSKREPTPKKSAVLAERIWGISAVMTRTPLGSVVFSYMQPEAFTIRFGRSDPLYHALPTLQGKGTSILTFAQPGTGFAEMGQRQERGAKQVNEKLNTLRTHTLALIADTSNLGRRCDGRARTKSRTDYPSASTSRGKAHAVQPGV